MTSEVITIKMNSCLHQVKRIIIFSEIEIYLQIEMAIGVQKYLMWNLRADQISFVFPLGET